jgi:4-methylaminobutanoate oxidase (formaldehyde-forming)
MNTIPDRHARIVIIGGGAIGTAVAYHLARAGETDVLLLEKSQLTHGSTWHAAGLVGQLRGKRNLTRLMQNSVAVFDRLESESGMSIDWKKVGSLRLASSPDRWSEIRRSMTQAKSFGVECAELSAGEARRLFPFITGDGIEGAAFIPGDGYIDPYALTQAYARVARNGGVKIAEGTTVTGINVEGRRATAVETDAGTIGCEIVVNCAGLWAKRVGEMAGVALAAGVVEHQYFVTEKKLEFDHSLTTLRDPDKNFYLKPDSGAFAIGGWEDGAPGCWLGRPPLDFGHELFDPDMDRLELFALPASERLPVLNDIGIQTIINGPIPVSADGEPIMGLAPELDNLFVACGFTAGIAASGGAGEAMANWILHDDPGMDLWAFDVRRFSAVHAQPAFLEKRAVEAYGSYYKIHWPGEEGVAGRRLRRTPLYQVLHDAGAVYGSKFGWERPNWFGSPGSETADIPSFEGKPNWFDAVGCECRTIRDNVALIDQSSFSKFELSGPGAFAALDKLAANRIPESPGGAVYTQLCNPRGGIEADLTIVHSGPKRFMIVTGAGFAVRDRNWIERHLPRDHSVTMRDVTGCWATINVCGPHSRDLIQKLTDSDIDSGNLPFLGARWIDLALARVLAVRIGYVGELGYELYLPQEYAGHVYEQLWIAGEEFGVGNAGYRAIESCRLEKGYLYWSSDIGPDSNPYEAGLGFCVALGKGDFIGSEALEEIRRKGNQRRMATLSLDGLVPLHSGEPITYNGEVIGLVTSAGYGHRLEQTIAFGYLPVDIAAGEEFEIEAFGRTYSTSISARSLYDPHMQRLKA